MNELGVRAGLSLEFYGLHRTFEYYQQAVYAVAQMEKNGGIFYLFYNCALEYILTSDCPEKAVGDSSGCGDSDPKSRYVTE